MTNRSANASIKGFFYQFDNTIVRILEATTLLTSIVVEGVEDIDLNNGDESIFVQCKYYEGSEYNHSLIKNTVIQMLNHFHKAGCPANQQFKYQLYGHYKEGQDKLPNSFDLAFLKKNFLSFKKDDITHEVHKELGINDADLINFHSLLNININAPSYDNQQDRISTLLITHIPGCEAEDAKIFYYPNAINIIQSLAIQPNINERSITKESFVSKVNTKEIVFSLWLQKKFGDNYYAKLIKRKFFRFHSFTKIPKASRIFVIDMTNEFDLSKAVSLLTKIGTAYSHKEHKRTPPEDRFCPYIFLRGPSHEELILLKNSLLKNGTKFLDGYPFHGSDFSPELLATAPTKENLLQLKFIPTAEQLSPLASAITGSIVEIFDFFKDSALDSKYLPEGVSHHPIKIDHSYFINEVLNA